MVRYVVEITDTKCFLCITRHGADAKSIDFKVYFHANAEIEGSISIILNANKWSGS